MFRPSLRRAALIGLPVMVICLVCTPVLRAEYLSWKQLKLVKARGVPQAADHKYAFQGTLVIIAVKKQSGLSFRKGYYNESTRKVKETIAVEAEGEWDESRKMAKETMELTFTGGKKAQLIGEFRFAQDPWIVKSSNSGVVINVKFSSERSPVPDFPGMMRKKRGPLTLDAVTLANATALSKAPSRPPPPPPPPPPSRPKYDLAGGWESNLGTVTLEQTRSDVKGSLRYVNGVRAILTGKLQGDRLSLKWGALGKPYAAATLQAYDKGLRWSGSYRDTSRGTKGTMTLKRPKLKLLKPFTVSANVAGRWNSNLGPVSFSQTGSKVRGELKFTSGGIGVINGTLTDNKIDFRWGMGGRDRGSGQLTLSKDQRQMRGTLREISKGTTKAFMLSRLGR